MIADDYEDDAILLERAMRRVGIVNRIVITRDGEETIWYLNGDGRFADRETYPLPDILLLDLEMPRKNGYEVLEWLRTQPHLKDLAVVVLSGSTDMRKGQRAYQLGAQFFLLKPCTSHEIAQIIATCCGCWSFRTQTIC